MERLIVYAYWPWVNKYSLFRKANEQKKKAVQISSCAAPGFIGRLLYGTHKQLKMTADIIGAVSIGNLFSGSISGEIQTDLVENMQNKINNLATKLLSST
ncbi:hypothetical protein [Methyloprofundus sp.]|uniref:hypothetical protein n=1 Tax=Methyloprofundus sp. TaxID=2020875 RepID=UPI003D095BDF